MEGKVYVVGAGPSDLNLFTLKGFSLLKQADIVIYDKNVDLSILLEIPDHATVYQTRPWNQMEEMIQNEVHNNKCIVWLKESNSFIQGEDKNAVYALLNSNIVSELVPGVDKEDTIQMCNVSYGPPLEGIRVIIPTLKEIRPYLYEMLRGHGAAVLEFPLTESVSIHQYDKLFDLVNRPMCYEWIAFTEELAVMYFFEQVMECNIDIRSLQHIKFAVIGKMANQALLAYGCKAELIAISNQDSLLARELLAKNENSLELKTVLIVTAQNEISPCYSYLKEKEIPCELLELYERKEKLRTLKKWNQKEIVAFTCETCVEQFAMQLEKTCYPLVACACTNQTTFDKAKEFGMQAALAKDGTMESLADCVVCISKGRE